jgi:hypothetical protein
MLDILKKKIEDCYDIRYEGKRRRVIPCREYSPKAHRMVLCPRRVTCYVFSGVWELSDDAVNGADDIRFEILIPTRLFGRSDLDWDVRITENKEDAEEWEALDRFYEYAQSRINDVRKEVGIC